MILRVLLSVIEHVRIDKFRVVPFIDEFCSGRSIVITRKTVEAPCGTGEVSHVIATDIMSGVMIRPISIVCSFGPDPLHNHPITGTGGVRLVCRVRVRAAGVFLRGLVLGGGDDAALISPD
jgi:hypothetical protein